MNTAKTARKSPICLYPDCANTSRTRGLCHGHYQTARAMIRRGRITEQSLESRGFMAPKGTGNGVINGSALFLNETARGKGAK